jgi:hypothetical protein
VVALAARQWPLPARRRARARAAPGLPGRPRLSGFSAHVRAGAHARTDAPPPPPCWPPGKPAVASVQFAPAPKPAVVPDGPGQPRRSLTCVPAREGLPAAPPAREDDARSLTSGPASPGSPTTPSWVATVPRSEPERRRRTEIPATATWACRPDPGRGGARARHRPVTSRNRRVRAIVREVRSAEDPSADGQRRSPHRTSFWPGQIGLPMFS